MHTQLRVTHPLSGQLKRAIATLLSAVVAGIMGAALPSVSPSMGELGVMLFLISGVAYLAAWVWVIYLLFSPTVRNLPMGYSNRAHLSDFKQKYAAFQHDLGLQDIDDDKMTYGEYLKARKRINNALITLVIRNPKASLLELNNDSSRGRGR